ncbi:hypothetical protein RIF29_16873 [Crotalaria pallida]|uniref:Uncharacterized protein n=1 Tax=Crotalaria pallida TaxID=3830 RepID=A0AAN9FI61_CROPI
MRWCSLVVDVAVIDISTTTIDEDESNVKNIPSAESKDSFELVSVLLLISILKVMVEECEKSPEGPLRFRGEECHSVDDQNLSSSDKSNKKNIVVLIAEKISAVLKAANVKVDSYWPSFFAKLAQKRNIEDLILNSGGGGGVAVAAAAPAAEEKKFIVAESYGGKFAVKLGLTAIKTIQQEKLKLKLGGVALGDTWISPIDFVVCTRVVQAK